MAQGIVVYYSRSGNTRQMAQIVAQAMNDEGLKTQCTPVDQVNADDLPGYDAIVLGSPTYYGQMATPIKQLIDETVTKHGQLEGKVGGAFTSSANIGGGNETTIIGMIEGMLIAGMVVQGDPQGDHYGPVAIGKPDDRASEQCARLGQRVARLANKLAP